jgi:hypothetical protein
MIHPGDVAGGEQGPDGGANTNHAGGGDQPDDYGLGIGSGR